MTMKQVSVFLENVSGRLAEVTNLLTQDGINLRAITIADTADFGILRMVSDAPERTLLTLENAGFTARVTEVLAVEVEDKPGGLATVTDVLHRNGVNIEYLYASLEQNRENAVVIFKVEDVELGLRIMEENGLRSISEF